MQIKRSDLIQEIKLRRFLRERITRLLNEGGGATAADETPHEFTGINELENVLKKVIPIIEDAYKALTTNPAQRDSFRAHILHAVIDSLATVENTRIEKISEAVEIEVENDDFIDITGDQKSSDEEQFSQGLGLENHEQTGRNKAYQTFSKTSVENEIIAAFERLEDEEDRQVFKDYLLTNLKLYFQKFENELASSLKEPPMPAGTEPVPQPPQGFA